MVTEALPTLYPEIREAPTAPGRGKHGYYRTAKGWIVVASTTPSNRAGYEFKGFTFLPQYGEFVNGTNDPRAKQNERDARGVSWNPAVEPWRLIFQKGGVKEFPAEQVIAYRWHVRPPYAEVTFPQLEDINVTTYQCPECNKGLCASTNPAEAAEQLKTHLTSGVNGRHKYTPRDLKELEKEWGVRFETSRVSRRPVVVESRSLEQPSSGAPKLTPGTLNVLTEYACRKGCGWAPLAESRAPAKERNGHEHGCEATP
jgi:hypothetical protein